MGRLEPVRDGNGRFRPGYSGNPGGRPIETAERKRVRELARECTEEAVTALREIATDREQQGMARVQACRALLDRGWGAPSDEAILDAVAAGDEHPRIVFAFNLGEDDDEIEGELVDGERRALPPPTS